MKKVQAIGPIFASMVVFAVAALCMQAPPSQAAPYLGCSTNGYIVRDNSSHTDIQAIDMVSGMGSSAGQIVNRTLNAIGYNPKDNYFYAWDLQHGVFVKVSSDFATTTPFGPGNGMAGYSGTTNNIFSGDVDTDGYYWFFVGSDWYKADLNTGTPTIVDSGTATPSGTNGTDWAFVPNTNKLYRAMDEGGVIGIWSFDRDSHLYSKTGTVSNVVSTGTSNDGDMGAVYADPDGNFYMSSNHSGKLFRVDLSDAPNFTAIELGANDPGSNDGARCALASVPIDFADAPAGYDTLIDDDGPRHSVVKFNTSNSTAPLMLGTNIDIEIDGFPNAGATGDDGDHESGGAFVDDERGVGHIVVTSGTATPLTVPVRVTNNTPQTAFLVGWVDLDNDGSFETSERVSDTVPANFDGYRQLAFPAPPAPYSVNTFARFRIFSSADTSNATTTMSPTGPATDGEVEDVQVQIGTYDVSKAAIPADGSRLDPGQTVTYTLSIRNTGSTNLSNVKIDDDLTDVLDDATIQGATSVTPAAAGTASINGNILEFVGDLGAGQTVTVTYSVKVKDSGSLGNAGLNNTILASYSASCHPSVANGNATVSDPDCQTTHPVNGLADTGSSMLALLLLAVGMFTTAGVILYFKRPRRLHPGSH